MKNEITFDREFIESIIVKLEEAYDIMCPCPPNFPTTESFCDSCRFKDICENMHEAVLSLLDTM